MMIQRRIRAPRPHNSRWLLVLAGLCALAGTSGVIAIMLGRAQGLGI